MPAWQAAYLLAVRIIRGAREHRLLAPLHGGYTLIPAADDAAHAKFEFERLVAIPAGIKLGAIQQRADVVNCGGGWDGSVSWMRCGAAQ